MKNMHRPTNVRQWLLVVLIVTLMPLAVMAEDTATVNERLNEARKDRELLEAAKLGDLALVKKILAKGGNVNAKDERGGTPLMRAADASQLEMTKLLIEKGADVNSMDRSGLERLSVRLPAGVT